MKIPHFGITFLLSGVLLSAQTTTPSGKQNADAASQSADQKNRSADSTPIEILSDTYGVNLGPYLAVIMHQVKVHWHKLVPAVARAPVQKPGNVTVEFAIMKDGSISGARVTEASGDESLDSAALEGVKASNPFPPTPSEYGGKSVVLRFHFYYNLRERVKISPPDGLKLAVGSSQQFSAVLNGSSDKKVNLDNDIIWTVFGDGCVGHFCGTISSAGLYTAPSIVPTPPTVIVSATLASDQHSFASVTVILLPLGSP
jgi:TonB family protein